LYDVTTDPVTLNTVGTSVPEPTLVPIYNDLGTGVGYGSFVVHDTGNATDLLSFNLNAAALNDITAAAGGRFSIGAKLVLPDVFGIYDIFGATQDPTTIQRLTLVTAPADTTPPTITKAGSGRNAQGFAYLDIRFQDTGSGLQSITVVHLLNAAAGPISFTPGTTAPVVVRFTSTSKTQGSSIIVRATDAAGNVR
jgi:hypothetical protein